MLRRAMLSTSSLSSLGLEVYKAKVQAMRMVCYFMFFECWSLHPFAPSTVERQRAGSGTGWTGAG
jgi:hypothetical protein